MASVNSATEQLAAQQVALLGRQTFFPNLPDPLRFVWLGAERVPNSSPRTFSWIDGSGTFTANDRNTTTPTYANWQAGENIPGNNCPFPLPCADIDAQPNGGNGEAVAMAYPDHDGAALSPGDWDDWTWGDALKNALLPALYQCCDSRTSPTTRFAGCKVSPSP